MISEAPANSGLTTVAYMSVKVPPRSIENENAILSWFCHVQFSETFTAGERRKTSDTI